MVLDEIDYKILRCLKKNAREKASAISVEISLSVSAVIERIRKLEASGIISGYTAIFDQLLRRVLRAYYEHRQHRLLLLHDR